MKMAICTQNVSKNEEKLKIGGGGGEGRLFGAREYVIIFTSK